MRFLCLGVVIFVNFAAVSLRAQSFLPTIIQALPSHALSPGGPAVTIDLRNYITVPGLSGTDFAQFDTVFGRFNVELRRDVAPQHVANFLAYVQRGDYANSFIHRAASFEADGAVSIVQGGGYVYQLSPFGVEPIARQAPVPLEYNLSNARGTLAAARSTDVNSATSEWYFNVRDNSTILNQSNDGGYTVFGRVLGTGMTVVDAMAALPRYNAGSPYTEIPLRNYTTGDVTAANLVVVNSIQRITLFPTGGGPSVLEFAVENSAPNVVTHLLSGTTLTLTPVSAGSAIINARATDTNGNSVTSTFTVTVAGTAPVFTAHPRSQEVAAGSTVVFNAPAAGAASYRWQRNGVDLPGATTATLVIREAAAADAGAYTAYATNAIGERVSQSGNLTVVSAAPIHTGRLVNLSILTAAGSGAKVLTMGASIGAGNPAGTLPLVIRAVGPTLAQPPFSVGGVLPDPVMTFYSQSNTSTPLDTNDNWGGSAAMNAAFTAVGAFALPPNSLDSAIVRSTPGVATGGYTVQVTGKGDASGFVIAEIYDASGETRNAATPRLTNLSTLAQIDAGSDLAVGFVLGGFTSRTVLVRGVGPSLAPLNVTGLMADPRLELFDNTTGQRVFANDDWAGDLELSQAAAAVGAFPLVGGTSKDAVMLVTLPPGAYSARINGVGNTGGTAIVEVYEVP